MKNLFVKLIIAIIAITASSISVFANNDTEVIVEGEPDTYTEQLGNDLYLTTAPNFFQKHYDNATFTLNDISITTSDDNEQHTVEQTTKSDEFVKFNSRENKTVVAVIDSGSDMYDEAYSVIGDDLTDTVGHGSKMVRNICANNRPYIISIKAFDSTSTELSNIIKAINLAKELDVDVINMSFSAKEECPILEELLQNVVSICSAGNSNDDATLYSPARYATYSIGACIGNNKTQLSNYNANYYIDAKSTSDAASLATGYYVNGMLDALGKKNIDMTPTSNEAQYDISYEYSDTEVIRHITEYQIKSNTSDFTLDAVKKSEWSQGMKITSYSNNYIDLELYEHLDATYDDNGNPTNETINMHIYQFWIQNNNTGEKHECPHTGSTTYQMKAGDYHSFKTTFNNLTGGTKYTFRGMVETIHTRYDNGTGLGGSEETTSVTTQDELTLPDFNCNIEGHYQTGNGVDATKYENDYTAYLDVYVNNKKVADHVTDFSGYKAAKNSNVKYVLTMQGGWTADKSEWTFKVDDTMGNEICPNITKTKLAVNDRQTLAVYTKNELSVPNHVKTSKSVDKTTLGNQTIPLTYDYGYTGPTSISVTIRKANVKLTTPDVSYESSTILAGGGAFGQGMKLSSDDNLDMSCVNLLVDQRGKIPYEGASKTYVNTADYKIRYKYDDATSNFNITEDFGTYTVRKSPISVLPYYKIPQTGVELTMDDLSKMATNKKILANNQQTYKSWSIPSEISTNVTVNTNKAFNVTKRVNYTPILTTFNNAKITRTTTAGLNNECYYAYDVTSTSDSKIGMLNDDGSVTATIKFNNHDIDINNFYYSQDNCEIKFQTTPRTATIEVGDDIVYDGQAHFPNVKIKITDKYAADFPYKGDLKPYSFLDAKNAKTNAGQYTIATGNTPSINYDKSSLDWSIKKAPINPSSSTANFNNVCNHEYVYDIDATGIEDISSSNKDVNIDWNGNTLKIDYSNVAPYTQLQLDVKCDENHTFKTFDDVTYVTIDDVKIPVYLNEQTLLNNKSCRVNNTTGVPVFIIGLTYPNSYYDDTEIFSLDGYSVKYCFYKFNDKFMHDTAYSRLSKVNDTYIYYNGAANVSKKVLSNYECVDGTKFDALCKKYGRANVRYMVLEKLGAIGNFQEHNTITVYPYKYHGTKSLPKTDKYGNVIDYSVTDYQNTTSYDREIVENDDNIDITLSLVEYR